MEVISFIFFISVDKKTLRNISHFYKTKLNQHFKTVSPITIRIIMRRF